MKKRNVVVVGGGNGTAISLLALKPHTEKYNISAITSMMDSGGSSGKLRTELGVLPTGDILRGILALSKYDYATLRSIFYENRFESTEKLNGHNLGNIFLALAGQYGKSLPDAIKALQQSLQCDGDIFPVTLDNVQLMAELADGTRMLGEAGIDRPPVASATIKKVWLEPDATIYEPAKQAILDADYIVLGPGSLFTSIVPNLLTTGFAEAILESKAKLVYVLGIAYESDGEKGPTTMSDFVTTLEKYLPRKIDMVVYNTHVLSDEQKKYYVSRQWAESARDIEKIADGHTLIGHDFEKERGGLSHERLAEVFEKCLV